MYPADVTSVKSPTVVLSAGVRSLLYKWITGDPGATSPTRYLSRRVSATFGTAIVILFVFL